MKKICLFLLVFNSLIVNICAQEHLGVPLNSPIYDLIETAELRGALTRVSEVKPYSYGQVDKYLDEIAKKSYVLTKAEQRIFRELTKRFRREWHGLEYGNYYAENNGFSTLMGVQGETSVKAALGEDSGISPRLLLSMFMRGDFKDVFSYSGEVGFGFENVMEDPIDDFDTFYTPYNFNRKWDAGFDGTPITYYLSGEFGTELFDDRVWLRFANDERALGQGTSDLTLSEDAHPFNALEVRARLFPWLNTYQIVGNLSHQYGEAGGRVTQEDLTSDEVPAKNDEISYRKNYTLQGFEFFPTENLYFSASATAIWSGEFDLGYMMPMIFIFPYQNTRWNYDNLSIALSLGYHIPQHGLVYGTLYLDEVRFSYNDLENPRSSQIAYQTGYKTSLTILPFTTLQFQYTKVEPYVYSHYPVDHPSKSYYYDTSYTNDGEGLGYPLQPNSDEIYVGITARPLSQWQFTLGYQLIRHGTNLEIADYDALGDSSLPIQGNFDDYLDYFYENQYGDKAFTKDGVYDWTNAVNLEARYFLTNYPAELYVGYGFSHTFWQTNDYPTKGTSSNNLTGTIPGYDDGSSFFRNIISIGFEVQY